MPRTIGKAFKISKKDVKSYGYASPNRRAGGRMTANAGVTAIAAINGPGAHARHHRGVSARAAMNGLSREERLARARKITGADRAAFARRMGAATKARGTPTMRTNASAAQIAAARRNIKKAIAARRSGSHRPNLRPMGLSRPLALRTNPWPGEVQRHSHAALRGRAVRAGKRPPFASTLGLAAKRRKKHKANSRKRKATSRRNPMRTNTHRRNFSAKQRAAALRNLRKARAARKHSPNARRRKSTRARRNGTVANKRRVGRKTHRRNFSAKQRAAALRNLKKARAARKHSPNARRRKHRRNGLTSNKRRTVRKSHRRNAKRRTVRKSHRRNFSAKQRAAALRNLKKARAARKHSPNRKHRRNGVALGHLRRKGLRRNMGPKAFRKNEYMATIKEVLKIGALTTAGFMAHKAVTKVFTDQILDRILGSSGAVTAAKPAAASGLEGLQPYRSVIGGAAVAAAGVFLANKVIKDPKTKMFVTAGMATSLVHSIAVVALAKIAPSYAGYLSGHDATAANISAMFGFGAGASIMPEYHPLSTGEYFAQAGLGEYFAQNGLGEYFAQNGLGAYTSNPDLMQAAAGYGDVENQNSNILDPGSDLDEQLSIAEAAAGVGAAPFEAAAGFGALRRQQPFEAQAGMGEFFAQNGLGAIATVPPTADTWIPGSSHGALWAGSRSITRGQAANSMTSAGVLETSGNQGVFG